MSEDILNDDVVENSVLSEAIEEVLPEAEEVVDEAPVQPETEDVSVNTEE